MIEIYPALQPAESVQMTGYGIAHAKLRSKVKSIVTKALECTEFYLSIEFDRILPSPTVQQTPLGDLMLSRAHKPSEHSQQRNDLQTRIDEFLLALEYVFASSELHRLWIRLRAARPQINTG